MACGAPECEAPSLMSHDGDGHCFFVRQPSTAEEFNEAILGTWASCCGAVRYGGRDREILIRLAENGLAESCDHRLADEPKPVNRNCVSFEFVQDQPLDTTFLNAQRIMRFFASALENLGGRVSNFQDSKSSLSFRYEWGVSKTVCHADLTLERDPSQQWLLKIHLDDGHPITGLAVPLSKSLQRDSHFQNVRYFAETDRESGLAKRHALPY